MRKLAPVLILAILWMVYPAPTAAQQVWCYKFDFATGQQGWAASNSPTFGTWTRWNANKWQRGSDAVWPTAESAIVRRAFTGTLTSIQVVLDTTIDAGSGRGLVYTLSAGDVNDVTPDTTKVPGAGPVIEITFDPVAVTGLNVGISNDYNSSIQFQFLEAQITEITLQGQGNNPFGTSNCGGGTGGNLTRPYRAEDENAAWGLFDYSNYVFPPGFLAGTPRYMVFAAADDAGAPVMSAVSGTVKSISPPEVWGCNLLGILFTDECLFLYQQGGVGGRTFGFSLTGVYRVTIDPGDGFFYSYIVQNADLYVVAGQTLEAGCVLGESIPIAPSGSTVGGFVSLDGDPQGIAFVFKQDPEAPLDTGIELLPDLTIFNETPQPCNMNPGLQNCINANPDFHRSAQDWQVVGDITTTPAGGLVLGARATVEQQLDLNVANSYGFTVTAQGMVSPDDLRTGSMLPRPLNLVLGTTVMQVIVNSGDWQDYRIPPATHQPDLGGTFYTLRIQNTGNYPVLIRFACLAETAPQLTPEYCYFQNADFDDLGVNWQGSVGTTFYRGRAELPNGGTLSQEITLPTGEYTLEVFVRIKYTNSAYTGDTGSADITYAFPVTPVSVGALDLKYNLMGNPGFPAFPQRLTEPITIASNTTAVLTLTASYSGNSDIQAIIIDRVCIDDGEQGGVTPPFAATCRSIPEPVNNEFSVWISYHWQQLDRFFRCDLMILLNRMYGLMDRGIRTAGFVARWNMAYLRSQGEWFQTDLFPWVAGHFRNIAIGQVTTINQAGGPGIWDVLLALVNGVFSPLIGAVSQIVGLLVSIINQAASLLLGTIGGLISVIISFITQIFGLIQLGQQLLATLINAYNSAAPIPIPGLPACSADPRSSALCIAIWVLDNTIFSGTGSVIVPILIAILSIHLLLWVVSEIKGAAVELGQTT